MLPAHLAENIHKQILFYLQSTFDFRDKTVERAFERFLNDPENGLFKGPWVQLRRPFRPADPDEIIAFDFAVPFHPFKHQNRAWRRLTSRHQQPQPTLVTTGTGSGKTECFMFPILDHCLRAVRQGQRGIKAILLYPMNALAADQEKRFARLIGQTPELKAAGIRVGNYTGRYDPAAPGASAASGTQAMGEEHGISHHGAQQDRPPDILLTNYKMLDYLLLRPQDQRLWQCNAPGVLRYLVLDELHTYDGAQGADVACLIRRLKERFAIPQGELCVVGTSATLDNREGATDAASRTADNANDARETGRDRLAKFASTLFEEDLQADAVIDEDRLTIEEIIDSDPREVVLPDPAECAPLGDEDAVHYAQRQAGLWGAPVYLAPSSPDPEAVEEAIQQWAVELGAWLKHRTHFKYLLDICNPNETNDAAPLTWQALVQRLSREDFSFNDHPNYRDRSLICASFFALVAQAKEIRSGAAFPLVPTQIQLWIRELRRLGRLVFDKPIFSWLDEPTQAYPSLPAFHCSECGDAGWVALHDPRSDSLIGARGVSGLQLDPDATRIYRGWFGYKGVKSPHLVVISPWSDTDTAAEQQQSLPFAQWYLCPKQLVLREGDGPCPLSDDAKRFRVKINRDTYRDKKRGVVVGDPSCPHCDSKTGVFFIGSQAATLSSVAIDELFGSVLNNDPKLLAFTDSVQDASHRAGFFTARTYQFTFRTALQHVIDHAGAAGVRLPEAGRCLLAWWSEPRAGWRGSMHEAMAVLMPPDLQTYADFLAYRNQPSEAPPPPSLQHEIACRLTWEATSEFGLRQTHGRTMEANGSACVGWDALYIAATIAGLRARLPGIDDALLQLSDPALTLWLYGLLHHYRLRGALDHPYLSAYARQNFWGKYPFGRTIPGRETYSPSGHYQPRLLVTQSQSGHDHILAPHQGSRSPWHLVWTRRALKQPNIEETSLLDLLQALLLVGTEAGLFTRLHQDGAKQIYAIAADAAILYADRVHLACSESERSLVRPPAEAARWDGAPSLTYDAHHGVYRQVPYHPRQRYYQERYRKGALRRVVASEHTGLLSTEAREQLEQTFSRQIQHADDPNVLTCTSTLEMGIDIGDLSSTMLCSIPPTTTSYLQRIGRAGRTTGTALIISVVNQQPHDLFFYGRPAEMLRGKVDPPGCWLDASAVLVRQFLAYCFDAATSAGILAALPRNGRQFVEDMRRPDGHLPRMMAWVTQRETELRSQFLQRFQANIQPDTRARFMSETDADLLLQRMHQAANEFDRQQRDLDNARSRLRDQLAQLDIEEREARQEIEQELRLLQGRARSLGRTPALELLTDGGLLPNYAFPERGVRFYGAVYNKHRETAQEHQAVEVVRPARAALRELAPGNHFYTHSRCFDIQQLAIGNAQEPLIEAWAICGACGHMRLVADLQQPEAQPACPQCGHDQDADSQRDRGQQRQFVEFARSQVMSHMEHYASLSGDRSDERNRNFYQVIRSYDLTQEAPSGAVGDDTLPFGIEYRASVTLREVNVGYDGEQGAIPFGVDQMAPEEGFKVCRDCGIVAIPGMTSEASEHRRSCRARRRFDKLNQEGRQGQPFSWESIYLYRELKSEAIRLLLPIVDAADLNTLAASLHFGLRLQFEGNPAHLTVEPQIMPDAATGMKRYYLVLLDDVPGGTGYLKTLYQQQDAQHRDGEGMMQVMRLAKNGLEICPCRQLIQDPDPQDTDGCYRCIRTFHLQHKGLISRERGITLLTQLIASGEQRLPQRDLAAINPHSLFGSMLEKKFVDVLQAWVVEHPHGKWESTIIRGNQGFRFALPETERWWELELQPTLGPAQGVAMASQPDFLLHSDDDRIKPVAIFTDGFQYHCHPVNRLADDMQKRRAILASGHYYVWNITWDDLHQDTAHQVMVCHEPVAQWVQKFSQAIRGQGNIVPDASRMFCNGMQQLKAFLLSPHPPGWAQLVTFAAFYPLQMLAAKRTIATEALQSALHLWRPGDRIPSLQHTDGGEWVYNDRASLNQDVVTYIKTDEVLSNQRHHVRVLARLGDREAECTDGAYHMRWRQYLACLNVFQFCENFHFWTSSEAIEGVAPEVPLSSSTRLPDDWQAVLDEALSSLHPYLQELALAGLALPEAIPEVEYFNDQIDDDAFAELAWPHGHPPIAVLAGQQIDFTRQWQEQGWKVVTPDDLQARGINVLLEQLKR